MYFSKSFTRLLDFSDRFCTISSGCYRIFLHFHCLFPTCLLHRHSLCLAVTPVFLHVPTDFAWFVPSIFPLIVIMFSSSFIVFSHTSSSWVFNMFCPAFFYYMFPIIFTSFLHRFLHHFLWFPAFSYLFNININPRVLPVSFIFRSFLHHFLSLLSHVPALSPYFSSMFTASSWFAPSIRSGFLHFPRDFPWFVPSIRSVFVRFPGDFVRFPLIVIMFSCSFIVFSDTSSWSLRPPKRRT